ncbi:hypothetical protein COOONC_09219 [Cooperia oncophora]
MKYRIPGERNDPMKSIPYLMMFHFTGSPLCYAFEHQRSSSFHDLYRCTGCRKQQTTTSIAVRNTLFLAAVLMTTVLGHRSFVEDPCLLPHVCVPWKYAQDTAKRCVLGHRSFVEDPCLLPHVCVPWKYAQDTAKRCVYTVCFVLSCVSYCCDIVDIQRCHEVAASPHLADKTPRQLWHELGSYIDFFSDEGTYVSLAASTHLGAILNISLQILHCVKRYCTISMGRVTNLGDKLSLGSLLPMRSFVDHFHVYPFSEQ